MKFYLRFMLAGLAWAVLISVAAAQTTFYVCPVRGDDTYSGTAPNVRADNVGPFHTLARAQRAVVDTLQQQDQPVTVMLRAGTHVLDETLVISNQDSSAKYKVTYRNVADEEPFISSGIAIDTWTKLVDEPDALPQAAHGHVYVADLPNGIELFHSLYDGMYRLKRARSQGFKPTQGAKDKGISRSELHYPEGTVLKQWDNIQDVEIYVRPWCLWAMEVLPLERVDTARRIAYTARPGIYPLTRERYERFGAESVWVENVLEALDEPGEWVVNTVTRKVYLWPIRDMADSKIIVPRLRQLVEVRGNARQQKPARNVEFVGLNFIHCDRNYVQGDERGLQHDWEMYDKPNSLLRFRWAQDCVVRNCGFLEAASTGLRLDLYAQNIRVEDCEFARLGGTGIALVGPVPGAGYLNKNNTIINNHIHHIGQLHWQNAAIMVWQSGDNNITHNHIHHTPYNGIAFSGVSLRVFNAALEGKGGIGELAWCVTQQDLPKLFAAGKQLNWAQWEPYIYTRDNLFAYNNVHHCIETLGDGNAVYVRMAAAGNRIVRNFFHDIYGSHDTITSVLRADDAQDGTQFSENIIYRAVCGGIALKAGNRVRNNFIIDILAENDPRNIHRVKPLGYMLSRPSSYSYDGSGYDWHDKSVITHNIYYSTGSTAPVFYGVLDETWPQEYYEKMKRILYAPQIDHNMAYWAHDRDNQYVQAYLAEMRQERGHDMNSIASDPLFVDCAGHDFRFRPDSPAAQMGIIELRADEMGLTHSLDARFAHYARDYEQHYAPHCFTGIKPVDVIKKKSIQKEFGHD